MAKTNVLIAEGRKLLREGVAALLKHTEVRIVGEAGSVESAMKLIQPLAVDVVLLNLTQLAHPGADAVRSLLNASSKVRVIVLAMHVTSRGLKEVLNAGAAGCLTKECGTADLLSAIRSAMDGKRYVCPEVTNIMIDGYVSPTRTLGAREQEILCRIASGQSVKGIAYDLKIGAKTVETHRRRLMTKLGRHSIAELTHYAVNEGFIALKTGN
jgi:DNA-binding NarL/FixJ family response regulator